MPIKCQNFGEWTDSKNGTLHVIKAFILENSKGICVKLISFGAGISDIIVPDKFGQKDHVVLGFESIEDYLKFNYYGTTVGRFANRIDKGKFAIGQDTYQLTINNNQNHLHGGILGWSKVPWNSYIKDDKVIFSLLSPDGSEGYPGSVLAQVTYHLDDEGNLSMDYQATTTKETPINMTNHSFFNLAGHGSGQAGLFEHQIEVYADHYLPVNNGLIPTGELKPVEGTAFDLRKTKNIKQALSSAPGNGFDHCFCLRDKKRGCLELAAKFTHKPSGRELRVFTTEPGVQVYTGNFIPKESNVMVGRGNTPYTYQGAFCCEPQNFPDAINQMSFPDCILRPGETYQHKIVYQFITNEK